MTPRTLRDAGAVSDSLESYHGVRSDGELGRPAGPETCLLCVPSLPSSHGSAESVQGRKFSLLHGFDPQQPEQCLVRTQYTFVELIY